MNIRLSTVYGPPLERIIGEDYLPVTIGRGEHADVSLDDRWVSRVHCLISREAGRVFVRDLESKHGTYVNEERIDQVELKAGDLLSVGLCTLAVEFQETDSHIRGILQ